MSLLGRVAKTGALTTVLGLFVFLGGCKSQGGDNALLDDHLHDPDSDDPGPTTAGARVRMSVFDPANRANVDAYIRGFKKLQSTDEGRRVWEALAQIHQDYCPHGNWYFLPWHRVYLYHFERAMAVASGKSDFALPYWDWDGKDRNRVPDEILDHAGLFWDQRGPNAKSGTSRMRPENVGEPAMTAIMAARSFLSFGSGRATALQETSSHGLLESMPHNSTHVWIGGDMNSFMSPRDPIFWMHHTNVDRIWSAWMAKQAHQGLPIVPPTDPAVPTQAWLETELREGFLEPTEGSSAEKIVIGPVQRGFAIKETFDSSATFGYTYDRLDNGLSLKGDIVTAAIATPREYDPSYSASLAVKLKQVAVFDGTRAVVFALDLANSRGQSASGTQVSATELLSRATNALRRGDGSLVLHVDEVPIPRNPSETSLAFYFNPKPQQGPEKNVETFLGTYSFFGVDHAHGGKPAAKTTNLTFDLSSSLRDDRFQVNAAGNFFVNLFINYTDDRGNDVTNSRSLPDDLKTALKNIKLRLEYSEL